MQHYCLRWVGFRDASLRPTHIRFNRNISQRFKKYKKRTEESVSLFLVLFFLFFSGVTHNFNKIERKFNKMRTRLNG